MATDPKNCAQLAEMSGARGRILDRANPDLAKTAEELALEREIAELADQGREEERGAAADRLAALRMARTFGTPDRLVSLAQVFEVLDALPDRFEAFKNLDVAACACDALAALPDHAKQQQEHVTHDSEVAGDARILELAVDAISRRMAELVTRLMNGETLSRGELMRYAACIGPRFQTPDIAAVMQKRTKP